MCICRMLSFILIRTGFKKIALKLSSANQATVNGIG